MKNDLEDIFSQIKERLDHLAQTGAVNVPKKREKAVKTGVAEVAAQKIGEIAGLAGAQNLEDVRTATNGCQRCKLCKGRNKIVFGVGKPNAKLMFVGEGPGADEDEQGEPFVGRAGQLLTKIIIAMGLKRDDVYIGNIVKCLRYNAQVQLGTGKWERIGRLVRQKYTGMVRSVDEKGQIINKKVIGWHETPIAGRHIFKLSFKSAKNAGAHKVAIYLTEDHPVLTNKGYVEAQQLKKSDLIATGQGISKTVKDLVYGMLLGDGHINKDQSLLSFSHSIKQESYAKLKISVLSKEYHCKAQQISVTARKEDQQRHQIIKAWTHADRSLRIIRNTFYDKNGKKVVPLELANGISPMTLAIWFMDDGYLRIRPPRKPSAEIATCSFSNKDLIILKNGLKKLGLAAKIVRNRLHFDINETVKLSKIIAPYVPPSMRYKLHPTIEKSIKFDKTLYKVGNKDVLYDKVEIEPITFKGSDKTFFCIDVKDTNNFVTTGGVVHNCRPPNNRNPEPDEMSTCMPYLLKQIELIRPDLIVCLGAIASKSLLATETPISKMRGKLIDWPQAELAGQLQASTKNIKPCKVMPTFHPAFLLRNPPMKKFVWEDMQEVLKFLGLPPPPKAAQ